MDELIKQLVKVLSENGSVSILGIGWLVWGLYNWKVINDASKPDSKNLHKKGSGQLNNINAGVNLHSKGTFRFSMKYTARPSLWAKMVKAFALLC